MAISEKGGSSFWEGKTELGPLVNCLKRDSRSVDIVSLSSVPLNLLSPRSQCLVTHCPAAVAKSVVRHLSCGGSNTILNVLEE